MKQLAMQAESDFDMAKGTPAQVIIQVQHSRLRLTLAK